MFFSSEQADVIRADVQARANVRASERTLLASSN